MANNISANPWYLDTASTNLVWPGRIYIKEMIWNDPTAAAQLVVKDQNGNVIINKVAATTDPFPTGTLGWVNGLVVTTMSAGTLSVFINK